MVNVAILGFGTVGSGVAEVLAKNAASIAKKVGQEIAVKYILDVREFPDSPFGSLVTHNFEDILHDDSVRIVVECIGGATFALDCVRRCLQAGKHVATSNKEMVATHGYELLSIAKEKNVNFLFEASVGGGIPIIRPMMTCLAANEIEEVCGILNGTTNYILTKMIKEGLAFDDVLRDAQEKGYAERNPAADVEGADACRKICILAALAYGRHVYPEQVPTEGITAITKDDISFAMAAGYKVKLLGRAIRGADGKIVVYVAPHFVPDSHQLANVEDVFNAIMVTGDAVGDVMFYGRGAGKLPTASAVVADVIDAAKHLNCRRMVDWEEGGADVVADADAYPLRWFIRTKESDEKIRAAFGEVEKIAIASDAQRGFLTPAMPKKEIEAKRSEGFEVLSQIPVLG